MVHIYGLTTTCPLNLSAYKSSILWAPKTLKHFYVLFLYCCWTQNLEGLCSSAELYRQSVFLLLCPVVAAVTGAVPTIFFLILHNHQQLQFLWVFPLATRGHSANVTSSFEEAWIKVPQITDLCKPLMGSDILYSPPSLPEPCNFEWLDQAPIAHLGSWSTQQCIKHQCLVSLPFCTF